MNIYIKSGLFLLASLSLFSCKKDYTCNCILFDQNGRKEVDTLFSKVTYKTAIYECNQRETQYTYKLVTGQITDTVLNCDLNR